MTMKKINAFEQGEAILKTLSVFIKVRALLLSYRPKSRALRCRLSEDFLFFLVQPLT